MSSVVLSKASDWLDTLKELIKLANNTKLLEEAGEVARKEIALTDEEQKKADEARAAIEEHKKTKAQIEREKYSVAEAQKDYQEKAAELAEKIGHHDIQATNLKENIRKYVALEAQTSGLKSQLEGLLSYNNGIKEQNDREKLRLEDLNKSLSKRLENVEAREKLLT